MKTVIQLQNVSKDFKTLNRREGLIGSVLDLFSRDYRTINAVKDISLTINQGEMVGYLGPNGAGKSTTIKMMTGVLEPTDGMITVNGRIPYKNRSLNAQNIGVVFGQRTQLWWSLPAIESFNILKDIYQIGSKEYKEQMDLYQSLIDISPILCKPVREMSLGQRTLCDILAAFLHKPPVIFLDEPTIGLDVSMKAKIRNLIKELNKQQNTTVLLTTHDIGDIDALCQRIIIIDKGSILYDGSSEKLKNFYGIYRTLKLVIKEDISEDILLYKLRNRFPKSDSLAVKYENEWVSILSKEDEISIMDILQYIQSFCNVVDIKIQEINTEDIIKKIYEGAEI